MNGAVIIEEVEECLKNRFGHVQMTPARLSNHVYYLHGTSFQGVVKIAKRELDDIHNEYRCLQHLEMSGLAPRPVCIESVAGTTVLVMEYREGQNLFEHLGKLSSSKGRDIKLLYEKLGKTLAVLHRYPIPENHSFRNSTVEKVKDDLLKVEFVPRNMVLRSHDVISRISQSESDWVLTHGDFGAHNVLLSDREEMCVFDWEFCERNHPLNDIANLYFTCYLHFSEHPGKRWEWFLNGYRAQENVLFSSEILKSYCVFRIWYVLLRMGGFPRGVITQWVDRLQWALDHDFD